MRRKRPRRGAILKILALLLIVYIVAAGVDIVRYQGVDETRRADVIIVLGAATTESGFSPVFRERLNHGAQLYQEGWADKIILTGGVGAGNSRSDAAIARDYLLAQGLPAASILLEETSTITEENLRNARQIMAENGLETALLVSDPLHMRRAMLIAADCGLTAFSSPTPTSMYRTPRTQLPFLLRELFFYVGYRWTRPPRGLFP